MATGPGFPGWQNVFIPGTNKDVSGRLIVGFSRNPKRFPLAKYVQYVPSKQGVGYYLKMTAQEAARVVATSDFLWPDGQERPNRNRGTESFNFIKYATQRYDYDFTIGTKTVDHADWGIVEQHSRIKSAQCMTARAIRLWDVLNTAGNWQTTADPDLSAHHTDTATNLGGGKWDVGTSTAPYIKATLDNVAVKITLDTLGAVEAQGGEMILVVNPNTARKMGESPEVHDFIKGSPSAEKEIRDGLDPNGKYGLPSSLYGYPIVVENTVKVTSRVGDTLARSFVVPDQVAFVLSRVGGIEGVEGAPSFSTVTIFTYEELSVERFDDPKNRLTEGHVVEDVVEVLTAPASGFRISAVY